MRTPNRPVRRALLWALLPASLALGSCDLFGPAPCDGGECVEPGLLEVLPVTPIAQQTEVWCWAATAEMIFRHYGLPNLNPGSNYQCGVVAAYFGPNSSCWSNCFTCVTTIASMSELQELINGYGWVARGLQVASPVLASQLLFRELTMAEVVREIDAGRVIAAGIGLDLPNISRHVTVIVGYDTRGPEPAVIVNDPYPYSLLFGTMDPYLLAGGSARAPGQYAISWRAFTNALGWANTIYRIQPS